MRLLLGVIIIQLILSGCSPNGGGFHAARSITPTDPTITPQNPMVIEPRPTQSNPDPSPNVLGFLEMSEVDLVKTTTTTETTLKLTATLALKSDQSTTKWSNRIELDGQIDIDGNAKLYPVGGDSSDQLPARARVTCLSDENPMDCDQAIVDVFVKDGEQIHATQVLADLRTTVPPTSFAPSPKKSVISKDDRDSVTGPTVPKKSTPTAADSSKPQVLSSAPTMKPSSPVTEKENVSKLDSSGSIKSSSSPRAQVQTTGEKSPQVGGVPSKTTASAPVLKEESKPKKSTPKFFTMIDPHLAGPQKKAVTPALTAPAATPTPTPTPKTSPAPTSTPQAAVKPEAKLKKSTPKFFTMIDPHLAGPQKKATTPALTAPAATPTPTPTPKTSPAPQKRGVPALFRWIDPGLARKAVPPDQIGKIVPNAPQPSVETKGPKALSSQTSMPVAPQRPQEEISAPSRLSNPKAAASPETNSDQTFPPPTTESAPPEEEELSESEGVDPEERPSLFIGTLHQPADELFAHDRPPKGLGQSLKPKPRPTRSSVGGAPHYNTTTGTRPRDQVVGKADAGRLVNSSDLSAKTNTGFKIRIPDRKRYYGSYELLEVISYLAKYSKSQPSMGTMVIGDISQKNGGKIGRHASHQNGLDADIAYPVTEGVTPFTDLTNGSTVSSKLKIKETWALMKAAWKTGTVDRIFVDDSIKRSLCRQARAVGDLSSNGEGTSKELLRRIRPTPGHGTHYHLRIRCSTEQPRCRMIGDPPRGSGC